MSEKNTKHVKVRSQNFSLLEKNILNGLIEKHRAVIDCKRTDALSNELKDEVWSQLTDQFNSMVETKRTTHQLRVWWENQKKRNRKEQSNGRDKMLSTGETTCNRSMDMWNERDASVMSMAGIHPQSDHDTSFNENCYHLIHNEKQSLSADSVSATSTLVDVALSALLLHCESEVAPEMADEDMKHVPVHEQNFTTSEMDILKELIEKHRDVIECGHTDTFSNDIKEEVWNQLTEQFNSIAGTQRSTDQLQQMWDNRKMRNRKPSELDMDKQKAGDDPCNWSLNEHVDFPVANFQPLSNECSAVYRERVRCESEAATKISDENMKQSTVRSQNYTNSEMNILIRLIEKHKTVIECKRTDALSARMKADVWKQIAADYNTLAETPRTTHQMRVWWDNQKKRSRTRLAEKNNKDKVLKCGEDPCKLSAYKWDERVAAIAGISTANFQPLKSECESVCSENGYKSVDDTQCDVEADCSRESVVPLLFDDVAPALPPSKKSYKSTKHYMGSVRIGLLTEQLESIKNNKELLMKECKELCIVRRRVRQWLEDMDKRQAALEAQIAEQDIRQKFVEGKIRQQRSRCTTFQKTKMHSLAKNLLDSEKFGATAANDIMLFEQSALIGERDDVTVGDSNTASESMNKTFDEDVDDTRMDTNFDEELTYGAPQQMSVTNAAALPKSFLCDLCGAVFTNSSSWAYHQSSHRTKNHVCTECNKQFSYAYQLQQHYFLHTGQRPFLCQHCGRSFHRRRLLVLHSRIHSTRRPLNCSHCSATFNRRCSLRRHVAYVHEPHRLLLCSYCNRRFDEPRKLRDHERTHSGDLPFECALCKKRYCSKHSLNNHKVYAHRKKTAA